MGQSIGTLLLILLVFVAAALGGTNGILEGHVRDKTTHEPIPGANVAVPSLQRGTVTDAEGRFEIQNIPAGPYDVRFSHIGHRTELRRGVTIQPDLRTRLVVELEQTNVELQEVMVTQEKPLIQTDITGTTFHVSGEEVALLPVDNPVDVLRLQPGVTLEGNVRGGRTGEVLYLVDGLPVKDVLSGELTVNLPKSSITGISISTGGFEPEYGNALSGVVNIVTKSGSNEHRFLVRADNDHLFGGTQNSKTSEVELSATGPIAVNKAYYVASLDGLATDTRWWQDFQNFYGSPIEKNLTGFGKIDYLFTPTLRLAGQVLFTHRDWDAYQFDWRFNLNGLPPEKRDSYRIAAILTNTVSDQFFYTASLSRFSLASQIGAGSKSDVPVNDPYQYDFFLQYIVSGKQAWWADTRQTSYTAKFDGAYRPSDVHLIKFGVEFTTYDVNSDILKYEPKRTYFGKPLINEPQLDFSTSYNYHPRSGSVYIQDKIDIISEGALLNVGVRYDFLDPTASRPGIEAIPSSDTAFTFATSEPVPATWKQQLSPRFGAALHVAENGYLFVNLGWYFQYPLFDYLYTGLDRAALAKGLSAITGNPDLEPERTMAYEISMRYSFTYNVVASATYFKKHTTNLVDTKTFVPGDSKLAGTYGYAEYVNTPDADAEGIELVVARERGEWVTGSVSYTFMTTEGTSGSAQDGFYIAQFGLPPAIRTYPLSWDQRHAVKVGLNVLTPIGFNVYTLFEYHSGRPYTNYPTATGFDKVDGGAFVQNNARMPSYTNADLRAEQLFDFGFWPSAHWKVYVDIRNIFNASNVKWMDSNARIGGELGDPSGYYIGRRTRVGLQVDF